MSFFDPKKKTAKSAGPTSIWKGQLVRTICDISYGVKCHVVYLKFIAGMAYQRICHRVVSVATVLGTVPLPLSPALTRSFRVPGSPRVRFYIFEIPERFHRRSKPINLPDGVDQLPYSREMMIVVFGDKIQMIHKPHRRLQTRVRNGLSK